MIIPFISEEKLSSKDVVTTYRQLLAAINA